MSDTDELNELNEHIKEVNKSYKRMNICLKLLNENALKDSLAVKQVTKLDGNCIFQSICDLGYSDSPTQLRNSVALMLYKYRNYKGYFKSQPSMTPKELFDAFPQDAKPRKVINNGTFKIVDYTYKIMCRDLSFEGSWERIWVEFVFMTLSLMFDIQIKIYQDEVKTPRTYEVDPNKTYKNIANIGFIGKCHYVPLTHIDKTGYNKKELPLYKLKPLKIRVKKEDNDSAKVITI